MNGKDPIARVFHDADGDWQFHGADESKAEDAVLVCLEHIVESDGSINQLADLPVGWCAWRETPSSPWSRAPFESRDE
jgi:hypothetical protein